MSRARLILSSVGLFALSGLIALLVDEYLFPLWYELGWRRPVEHFLESYGDEGVAGEWSAVWLRLPAWVVAALWGFLLGRLARARWLHGSVLAAVGFFAVPQLWLLALDIHPMLVSHLLRDLVAAPLLVGAAYLGQRRRG
ncbi:MAG: hypothetical protein HYZ27_09865, partial [Deltaproteobacteria bacterium]|nr:hypothetical protein [Deltaproteobacteria bacterium]